MSVVIIHIHLCQLYIYVYACLSNTDEVKRKSVTIYLYIINKVFYST